MKPTKNRVMCADCGRSKMLFETESKAKNFIKWNGDDIDTNGGVLRPYYCPACGGYHISSKPHKKSYDYNTDRLIESYYKNKKATNSFKEKTSGIRLTDVQIYEFVSRFTTSFPRMPLISKRIVSDLLSEEISKGGLHLDQFSVDSIRCRLYNYYKLK